MTLAGCQIFQVQSVEHLCSILPDFNWQRARAVPQLQLGFLPIFVQFCWNKYDHTPIHHYCDKRISATFLEDEVAGIWCRIFPWLHNFERTWVLCPEGTAWYLTGLPTSNTNMHCLGWLLGPQSWRATSRSMNVIFSGHVLLVPVQWQRIDCWSIRGTGANIKAATFFHSGIMD